MKYIHEYAKPFYYQGSEEGCLLIHGFTGSPAHLRLLGEFLHSYGYTVSGILLPGHGTCLEDMEKTNWCDWLEFAEKEYLDLRKRCKKVYVIGLSMGGLLALLLAGKQPLDKIIGISTPIRIYDRLAPLACIVKYFRRYSKWKSTRDCDEQDRDFCIGYDGVPIRCVPDLLTLIKMVKHSFGKITCPVLIIQSNTDETVIPASAQVIYNRINSKEKEILWLQQSRHVCLLDIEKEKIHNKIYSFLKA